MLRTVYALSSGYGTCGVAVIRVTGGQAGPALLKMTGKTKLPKPRHATMSKLIDPCSKEVLDHALTLWFPGPKSFTGEDSAEFQVHGGHAVVKSVLSALGSICDLQPAQAGDFTKRAFANGKLDLTQVEGLADLIHAETEQQRKAAIQQLDGGLFKQFMSWRSELIKIMANIEAYIDFAESEDIEQDVPELVRKQVLNLKAKMEAAVDNSKAGERLRKGVQVVIVGKPNVGKSTLLNQLVQRPAAIVSPIPGTTRDIVETRLDLKGYPVTISDTAGIREETSDVVEQEGVRRAIEAANQADIIVLVQDATDELEHDLSHFGLEHRGQVIVNLMNKVDLKATDDDNPGFIQVSGKSGQGLDDFLHHLFQTVQDLCQTQNGSDCPGLTRSRHRLHLSKAVEYLSDYLEAEQADTDLVICAHHLRKAVREIGQVSGQVSSEQILDVIFADFCIGK